MFAGPDQLKRRFLFWLFQTPEENTRQQTFNRSQSGENSNANPEQVTAPVQNLDRVIDQILQGREVNHQFGPVSSNLPHRIKGIDRYCECDPQKHTHNGSGNGT